MSIYTRTGDRGETSLFGGKRVMKSDGVIEVLGSLDELNSHLGLIDALEKNSKWKKFLTTIQEDIQKINGYICCATKTIALGVETKELEEAIDDMEKGLPELHSFILPGGTVLSGEIHTARSVCRRTERIIVREDTKKYAPILMFLNRLSDFLFTLARFESK